MATSRNSAYDEIDFHWNEIDRIPGNDPRVISQVNLILLTLAKLVSVNDNEYLSHHINKAIKLIEKFISENADASNQANEVLIKFKILHAEVSLINANNISYRSDFLYNDLLEAVEEIRSTIEHATPFIEQGKITYTLASLQANLAFFLSKHAEDLYLDKRNSDAIICLQIAIDVLKKMEPKYVDSSDKENIATFQFNLAQYYRGQGKSFYHDKKFPEAIESLISAKILFGSTPKNYDSYKEIPEHILDIEEDLISIIADLKKLIKTSTKEIPYRKILYAMETLKKEYPVLWKNFGLDALKLKIQKTISPKTFLQEKENVRVNIPKPAETKSKSEKRRPSQKNK